MIDVQTDITKHLPNKTGLHGTNMARILVFDSRYDIDFEILTPASPITVDGSLIKAPYYKTWRDKSCFRSLPDLLTKKG